MLAFRSGSDRIPPPTTEMAFPTRIRDTNDQARIGMFTGVRFFENSVSIVTRYRIARERLRLMMILLQTRINEKPIISYICFSPLSSCRLHRLCNSAGLEMPRAVVILSLSLRAELYGRLDWRGRHQFFSTLQVSGEGNVEYFWRSTPLQPLNRAWFPQG